MYRVTGASVLRRISVVMDQALAMHVAKSGRHAGLPPGLQ